MNTRYKIKARLNPLNTYLNSKNFYNEKLEFEIDVCKSDWQQFNDIHAEIEILGVHDDDDGNEQEIFEELYFTTLSRPTKSKHRFEIREQISQKAIFQFQIKI